jgi:hypothetical protein
LLLVSMISLHTFAQEEEKEKEDTENKLFKKENLFTGGTLNVSFFDGTTQLGITPYFGYSINKYVDVAISMNVNYISQRDYSYYGSGDKLRQTIYGPGAFVRLYPVRFLFAHAQFDYNFIRYKYIAPSNSGMPNERLNLHAPSFLVGGGFASGRGDGSKSFYYISILWDVAKNLNSPYVDVNGRALPQIRAGYNIALFQGRYDDRD